MREKINEALKASMKKGEKLRVSTLRLVNSAITDRDIVLRGKGKERAGEDDLLDVLAKMVKQREESARLFQQGARADLEKQELDEIAIIREFLPKQLSETETVEIIRGAIRDTGSASIRDMGKVMAFLKENFRGRIDMAKAGAIIKGQLGSQGADS